MPEPKPISKDAVPAALEKALRYRLLNEPLEAESICRDVLGADPQNQGALVTLLLALTDQFEKEHPASLESATDVLAKLAGDYEAEYYAGIISERWGKARLAKGMPRDLAIGWFREAMRHYESAEALSKPDDPDAVLRWNTCARILKQHLSMDSGSESVTHDVVAGFGDDVPPR